MANRTSYTEDMQKGYPAIADILTFLNSRGLEWPRAGNELHIEDIWKTLWAMANFADFAGALGVYKESDTTFRVRAGRYVWGNTIKTYTQEAAVDPTDNDTTYVWLTASNALGSAVDGTGWPAAEHLKLAEVVVDSDGVITSITDLRGQALMQAAFNVLTSGDANVEALPVYWDSPSPADADEIRIPIYANNDADEKTEVARITVTLDDVSDGTEDASISLSAMADGSLTSIGDIVGSSATQTLTNKTLDGDDNTIQDLNADALKVVTDNMAVPFILTATLTAGNTVQIHNADAPFKYRVIDVWSVATSADAGTWKVTDGTNDITDAVAVTATDKTLNYAGTIDDAYHEIAANGSLSVVGDGSLADVIVYIQCVRVS